MGYQKFNNRYDFIRWKKTADDIKEEIALEVSSLINNGQKKPHLAAILVGNDGASETYINAKVKACHKVGFKSTLIRLDTSVSELQLLSEIKKLIMIQM